MAKKQRKLLSDTARRVISLIIGGTCSALVLAFSVLAINSVQHGNYDAVTTYLLWIFIFMAFSSVVVFVKNRTKHNLIKCIVLFVLNLALGIIIIFANANKNLFSITAGLYCLNFIIGRVFTIIEKRNVRAIVLNSIIIVFAALLSVGLFISVNESDISAIILVECLFIAITSFLEVATIAFSQLKFTILFKIVVKTFALEVLFGLLALMVASALVLMTVEAKMNTFGDALWYCFAIISTIGFGDLAAETLIGRLISVALGTYGIIAVAVITSIIVNLYNETSGKKDAKEIKNIQKEEDIKNK